MKNLIKLTVLLAATFLVTNQAVAKSVSKNISQAPEIAASYSQVQSDLAKHIGVNVRWGGQVIGTNKLDKVTRVTLLSYPLDAKGKPSVNQAVTGEVFAVNFNKETLPKRLAVGNFITVYGTVNGGVKLVNGPLETIVPVIASQEAKKWKARSIAGLNRNRFASDRIRYYNSLGFSGSRFGFAGSRFGFGSSRFGFGSSKFGFGGRGFSKFSRFGRF